MQSSLPCARTHAHSRYKIDRYTDIEVTKGDRMNTRYMTLAYGASALLFIAWAGREENGANFYGTLTPRDGAKINVEDIKIKNQTEIVAYLKPETTEETTTRTGTGGVTRTSIVLENKPIKIGPIKFTTIKIITIPHPHTDWTYQENEKAQKKKYTAVTKKYTEVTIDGRPYLLPKRTTVKAIVKDTGNAITIEKISRLQKIHITGYTIKNEPTTKKQNKKTTPRS